MADHEPFPEVEAPDTATLFVGFLHDAPSSGAKRAIHDLATTTDHLTVKQRQLYWLCETSSQDSPLTGARLEKALGQPTTLRNVNTINRLVKKFAATKPRQERR